MIFASPLGFIKIREKDQKVSAIDFVEKATEEELAEQDDSPLLQEVKAQVLAYFKDSRHVFSLPLALEGSEFQLQVWQELLKIPSGETRTYGDLAATLAKPQAARAVGRANHCNKIAIVVPCHRVIGKGGDLVGYAGGLPLKSWLLRHEGFLH